MTTDHRNGPVPGSLSPAKLQSAGDGDPREPVRAKFQRRALNSAGMRLSFGLGAQGKRPPLLRGLKVASSSTYGGRADRARRVRSPTAREYPAQGAGAGREEASLDDGCAQSRRVLTLASDRTQDQSVEFRALGQGPAEAAARDKCRVGSEGEVHITGEDTGIHVKTCRRQPLIGLPCVEPAERVGGATDARQAQKRVEEATTESPGNCTKCDGS